MKILLAADGSAFTKRMLAYVAAHDEWLGPNHRYTVVNVVPKLPPHPASFLDREVLKRYYADEAEKVFRPIRVFFKRLAIEADYISSIGHPADVIAGLANRGAFDLLMMGSHGHGSVGNLVMGSVATKVVASCKVPVLLVR